MFYGRRKRGVYWRTNVDDALYDVACAYICPLSDCAFAGSPWDEDKAMMARWGLEGMASFEQVNVARKEGAALAHETPCTTAAEGSEGRQETSTAC